MIIKFKTRKNIYSAKQQAKYILLDKGKIKNPFETAVIRNINRLDLDTIHRDFLDNYKNFQKERKGGTALYHEIIAINKKDQEHITKDMLNDLIDSYIKMRGAENALCIAQIHDNQHIHIMLSGSELRSSKGLRMSKDEMQNLLLNYERRHIRLYPQLQNSIAHTNKRERSSRDIAQEGRNTRRDNEHQMKLRMGSKPTQKEIVFQKVSELFENSSNKEELIQAIQKSEDLQIYTYRGILKGVVINDKRKYRFSTLGIEKERLQKLEKIQSRLQELKLLREMKSNRKTRDISRDRG